MMSMVARFAKIACVLLLTLSSAYLWADSVLQSSVTYVQPGCGLVLWPDNAEDLDATYNEAIALEYLYGLPCKVVTGKQNGVLQYNWTWLDNILNEVSSRGHQLVLRWRYAYPNGDDLGSPKGKTAVPQYIKDMPGYQERYFKGGDGPTWYPDWRSTELQWFTRQFFVDFAARYGSDSRIAYLEVGFGHWGEYHIYDGDTLKMGINFPTKQYQHDFFLHLDSVMPIPWAVSIDASDDEYTPFMASPDMLALTFGLFDDSFMHKEHEIGSGGDNGYNEECWRAFGLDRWQTGVCGGEISYYKDADQRNFLNPAGMYGHTWEQQAAKYHISFMIANDAPVSKNPYGNPARFLSAGLASGYHFLVTEAAVSASQTQVRVTNTGVAPLYRDAFFAIGSSVATTSLRGLLPGDTAVCTIPAPLTSADDLRIESAYVLASRPIQFEADCPISVLTDLELTESAVDIKKILLHGRICILRNNQAYDILGRMF